MNGLIPPLPSYVRVVRIPWFPILSEVGSGALKKTFGCINTIDILILGFKTPLRQFARYLCLRSSRSSSLPTITTQNRGADKSLARPGRKQANVSVRIA